MQCGRCRVILSTAEEKDVVVYRGVQKEYQGAIFGPCCAAYAFRDSGVVVGEKLNRLSANIPRTFSEEKEKVILVAREFKNNRGSRRALRRLIDKAVDILVELYSRGSKKLQKMIIVFFRFLNEVLGILLHGTSTQQKVAHLVT